MHGTGVPLATPFDESGALDEESLSDLVEWVEARGADFLVPCGSTSEAPLMSPEERTRVIERVADEANAPVLAGTGYAGYAQTIAATETAAEAGADAALVVTPYYYPHAQSTLESYYRRLADESPLPIYLYSVPPFTRVTLEPKAAGALSEHENVVGMKDSSGDMTAFQRIHTLAGDDFDLLVGAGSVYASALDAGASGGILALANVVPERASEVYRRHAAGDDDRARELNAALVELNRAVTERYGIPGLKAAMRDRGAPAGYARAPFERVDEAARDELNGLVEEALSVE
ncbi:dihydrodipicolinate synthase family protein [Halomarina halobia]|uniref:Dihydrodipicolinate synthase family protein n=1 Tax=Halomarina halobia TaxID=3033386 RepID=A0ABD6A9Q3_9EURY|nr:dihydrodipicolinate synthase family protein [Halomarina sp. PSR21]